MPQRCFEVIIILFGCSMIVFVEMLSISWYNGNAKWYKMKKVQGGAFRRVPEGEKYKISTSREKERGATPFGVAPENP